MFAHKSFVLACFLRISRHNVWVSQSILLQLLPMSIGPKRILNCFSGHFFKNRCGRAAFYFNQ